MSLEKPLIGVVDQVVSQRRFQLKPGEYGIGENTFEGRVMVNTSLEDWGPKIVVDGWGCGVRAVHIAANLAGIGICQSQALEIALEQGAEMGDTAGVWAVCVSLQRLGLAAKTVSLAESTVNLVPYIKKGCLFVANMWEMSWDEVPDSRQRGDGHWATVVGVSADGRVLVADSSLRLGCRNTVCGMWWLTREGYARIAQDCTGEVDHTETMVNPGGDWGWMFGLLVGPKGMRMDQLEAMVAKHGGVVPYDMEG
jgi:hypothetical protein